MHVNTRIPSSLVKMRTLTYFFFLLNSGHQLLFWKEGLELVYQKPTEPKKKYWSKKNQTVTTQKVSSRKEPLRFMWDDVVTAQIPAGIQKSWKSCDGGRAFSEVTDFSSSLLRPNSLDRSSPSSEESPSLVHRSCWNTSSIGILSCNQARTKFAIINQKIMTWS